MIARIPTRRDAKLKIPVHKLPAQPEQPAPRPAPELVFSAERCPRGDEWNHFDLWPETRAQFLREGFGEESDIKFLRRGAQEWRGNDQIPQAPKFQDDQTRFHAVKRVAAFVRPAPLEV